MDATAFSFFIIIFLKKNTLDNNQGYKVSVQYSYQEVISDKAFREQYHLLSLNKGNMWANCLIL